MALCRSVGVHLVELEEASEVCFLDPDGLVVEGEARVSIQIVGCALLG